MKKHFLIFIFSLFVLSINAQNKSSNDIVEKKSVSKILDDLNIFASKADFKNYFGLFAEESTYVGTDATEIWDKKAFMHFAKPFFDKGKAWNFTSVKRNIYISKDGKMAWFDELLDTQMKICRGSGVLEKVGKTWKIKQYVLSMTVPNEVTKEVVQSKSDIETLYLETLKKEK